MVSEPRRGFGWATLFVVALASATAGALGAWRLAHRSEPAPHRHAGAVQYTCPMHPSVVQDAPGSCPICGMKLVAMPASGAPEPSHDEAEVEGLATVRIDPMRQQLIGLRTERVARGSVGAALRTVGRVAVDETRVRHINIRVPAHVEQIYVDFVGKLVRKGEPLFSVYSPELLAAQQELLLALRADPSAAGPMVGAARRKLELWNVPEPEIAKVIATRQPLRSITLYSPIAGVVTVKDVVQGSKLDVGAMPYEVVDLSHVWVLADVYESELRRVQVGMPASFVMKSFPGQPFEGSVSFVAPLLNRDTRTASVRLAFANPEGQLRPEMFGEVLLRAPARDGLRVPRDAVIDSGTRTVVFVALGDGKFEPREVSIGDNDATHSEVLSGLREGEEVVVRANFLVDSESRLRASLAALGTGEDVPTKEDAKPAEPAGQTAPHAGHGAH